MLLLAVRDALGWLFGAMAGGTAFGSSFGALLEPSTGRSGESGDSG